MILTGTEAFFTGLDMSRTESAVVYSIKTYISENYGSIDLSIMAISDHVKLSSSYVCTLFKSETGITLNQYITEYRLGRAKELLSDPRMRIADIAEAVGYSDSNYFSKIFRKSFGLSPSEFRESL
jgi:two-component system response regulator YesN